MAPKLVVPPPLMLQPTCDTSAFGVSRSVAAPAGSTNAPTTSASARTAMAPHPRMGCCLHQLRTCATTAPCPYAPKPLCVPQSSISPLVKRPDYGLEATVGRIKVQGCLVHRSCILVLLCRLIRLSLRDENHLSIRSGQGGRLHEAPPQVRCLLVCAARHFGTRPLISISEING